MINPTSSYDLTPACTFTTVFLLSLSLLPITAPAEPEGETDPLADLEKSDYFTLRVHDQARVIRTVLPDLSTRSLAVGLPDGLSYAFDTKKAVVAYAWTGDFLDMSGVRKGRGRYNKNDKRLRLRRPGQPLGNRVRLASPAHQPLRIGEPDARPDIQFLGYKNPVDALPMLVYRVDDIQVEHTVRMQSNDPLRVTYKYRLAPAPDQPLYFMSGREQVTVRSEDGNVKDGSLHIPATNSGSFTVQLQVGSDQ